MVTVRVRLVPLNQVRLAGDDRLARFSPCVPGFVTTQLYLFSSAMRATVASGARSILSSSVLEQLPQVGRGSRPVIEALDLHLVVRIASRACPIAFGASGVGISTFSMLRMGLPLTAVGHS